MSVAERDLHSVSLDREIGGILFKFDGSTIFLPYVGGVTEVLRTRSNLVTIRLPNGVPPCQVKQKHSPPLGSNSSCRCISPSLMVLPHLSYIHHASPCKVSETTWLYPFLVCRIQLIKYSISPFMSVTKNYVFLMARLQ